MKIVIGPAFKGFEELKNALINSSPSQLKGLSQKERKVCQKVVELLKNPDKGVLTFSLSSQPNLAEIAKKITEAPREIEGGGYNPIKAIANIFGRISSKALFKNIGEATTQTQKFIYLMNISNEEKKRLLALNKEDLKKEFISKVSEILKSPQQTNAASINDENNFLMFASNILRTLGDKDNPIHDQILKRMYSF